MGTTPNLSKSTLPSHLELKNAGNGGPEFSTIIVRSVDMSVAYDDLGALLSEGKPGIRICILGHRKSVVGDNDIILNWEQVDVLQQMLKLFVKTNLPTREKSPTIDMIKVDY